MTEFLYILVNIQLPIMILIAVGFVFQKILKTDTRTFSKIMIYLLIPVVIFVKIYNMEFSWSFFLLVVPFILLLEVLMFALSQGVARVLKLQKSKKNALCNAFILINTGNYGIPLIELVFQGNPMATASQLIIIVIQNITSNTLGVFQASAGNASGRQALKNVLKMPALYMLGTIALVKVVNLQIPTVVMIPLNYLADAFIGMALLTLGVQLAEVKSGFKSREIWIGSVLKLIITPIAGFGLVTLLGVKGLLAQALVIGISTPTAVNSAIIAREFNCEPDFASQFVMLTTIFCTFTLPVVIYLCQQWF